MYLQSHKKSECCGCTACCSVCPRNCLEMEADEFGFMYPVMKNEEACINCNLCNKVCPLEKNKSIKPERDFAVPKCYYGWHCDEKIRNRSTSGAAFVAICQACEQEGYSIFFGSKYNSNNKAIHGSISSTNEISDLVTSKYVQSNLLDTYQQVHDNLRAGKKVVFSGTPCQIDGLLNFIPTRLKESLVTISLVCHGVASPLGFEKYLNEVEEKENSKVDSVRFRDKKKKDGILTHRYTTLTLDNGEVISETENPYTVAFGLGLMHRESCSTCPYTTPYRACDFTIGDFWGIEDYYPKLKSEISKGISLILAHSEKAQKLVPKLEEYMILHETPLEYSQHIKQQQLRIPFSKNPRRDKFLKKVLVENKSFVKTASSEIRHWRYINFMKRIVRSGAKIFKRRIK